MVCQIREELARVWITLRHKVNYPIYGLELAVEVYALEVMEALLVY